MTESTETTKWGKWLRPNWKAAGLPAAFSFEAKICKGTSLPFSSVKEHQVHSLLRTKHGAFFHKIMDAGYENPLDGTFLAGQAALVVIFWRQHRGDRRFTVIDVDDWLKEKETSDRKSIVYERSCEIGRCLTTAVS